MNTKMNELIKEMEQYASINNVPIMLDDTISYILNYIKDNNIKSVLEIGTAIGYSTIRIASLVDRITSIERDENRYNVAVTNVLKSKLSNIELVLNDALEIDIKDKYDLVIIDAAKSQNIKFFEKFKNNLKESGTMIVDNMNFHGYVFSGEVIKSRNLRQMIRKLEAFWTYMDNQKEYSVEHLELGDGILVCKKSI